MESSDKQKVSLLDRIFCKEALILMVGLFYLGSAIYTGDPMQYFWAVMIMSGGVALHFVRKKDWKKHWELQEQLKVRLDQERAKEREKRNEERQ